MKYYSKGTLERYWIKQMIEVMISQEGILVRGHAEYAEEGKDIVCAGITALTQTLVESIESLSEDTIKYDISPGMAAIYYRDLSERSQTLVDSFFIGVSMIASEFPENVRIV